MEKIAGSGSGSISQKHGSGTLLNMYLCKFVFTSINRMIFSFVVSLKRKKKKILDLSLPPCISSMTVLTMFAT